MGNSAIMKRLQHQWEHRSKRYRGFYFLWAGGNKGDDSKQQSHRTVKSGFKHLKKV